MRFQDAMLTICGSIAMYHMYMLIGGYEPKQAFVLTIGAVWFGASLGLLKYNWDRLFNSSMSGANEPGGEDKEWQ